MQKLTRSPRSSRKDHHAKTSQKAKFCRKLTIIIEKRIVIVRKKLRSPEPSSSCSKLTRSTERLPRPRPLRKEKTLKKQLKEVKQLKSEEVVSVKKANL